MAFEARSLVVRYAMVASIVVPLLAAGCGQSGPASGNGSGGNNSSSGGSNSSGGSTGSGGSNASSGGSGSSSGGANGSGGKVSTGGSTGSGGSNASSGGAPGSGGGNVTASGGSGGAATGGTTGSGGSAGATTSTGGKGGGMVASSGGAGGGSSSACPVISDFDMWPSGKGPSDIGKLAVANFKSHTGDAYTGAGYAWTFAYYASLQLTQMLGDTATNKTLVDGFERYASGQTQDPTKDSTMQPPTVDTRAFGDLPLEIFMENGDMRCKTLGVGIADGQWTKTTSDGITSDARYWSDDMFMITSLQVFAYRATKDMKYLDRAAKTMMAYLPALQQSTGLMWHTKDSKPAWGRANGWFASGMTEILLDLPAGAARDAIMAGYKKMMDGLLAVQITSGTDAGMWRQVLDLNTTASKPESSCTAMFTFALVTGLKNGWLSGDKYVTAAKNGWTALGVKTNGSGVLDQVCPGTGAATTGQSLSQQQVFYTSITFQQNDQHGQAPLLWAARALLRKDCPGVR